MRRMLSSVGLSVIFIAGVRRDHHFKHIDFIPPEQAKVWVAAALEPKMVCKPNTAHEDESGAEGKSSVGGIY